ncbi:unnamed protein product [Cochlearia groenlandica]
MNQQKKGRKRKITHNVSITAAVQKRTILPTQYNITPATEIASPQEQVTNLVGPSKPPPPGVSDYPPPRALFQNSTPPPHNQTQRVEELENSAAPHDFQAQSYLSSEGNNFGDAEDALSELHEETLTTLNALLRMPGREQFVTVLSPTPTPNTTW